jgi:hypothetical protein
MKLHPRALPYGNVKSTAEELHPSGKSRKNGKIIKLRNLRTFAVPQK